MLDYRRRDPSLIQCLVAWTIRAFDEASTRALMISPADHRDQHPREFEQPPDPPYRQHLVIRQDATPFSGPRGGRGASHSSRNPDFHPHSQPESDLSQASYSALRPVIYPIMSQAPLSQAPLTLPRPFPVHWPHADQFLTAPLGHYDLPSQPPSAYPQPIMMMTDTWSGPQKSFSPVQFGEDLGWYSSLGWPGMR